MANPAAHNMTVMGAGHSSPRGNMTITARSGMFHHGSLTVRGNVDEGNALAKEFAILRGDANPLDDLNNTVDVVDFKLDKASPLKSNHRRGTPFSSDSFFNLGKDFLNLPGPFNLCFPLKR